MKPNAFFPSLDIGTDPAKIRDWAQAAEDLGYAYIEVPDHVEVLRRLWSGEVVSFTGRFHSLQDVSMLPSPVQRPIPIWFGGTSDAVVRRAARLGDGWMPIMAPDAQAEQKLGALRDELKSFGRDPA